MMKYRRDQDKGHEKRPLPFQGKPKLDNRKEGERVEAENGGSK